MNYTKFFERLRGTKQFPALTARQTQGMATIIDVWAQWYQLRFPIEFLAAALAQIGRETGYRMVPVMETFASTPEAAAQILERAFVRGQLPWVSKRYWLPDSNGEIWIGRGDIQITLKPNYTKLRKAIKEAYDIDIPLDVDPDLALDPVTSAVITFEGMTKGLFTSKKLEDFYSKGKKMDYVGQRAVVNGDSKDEDIAKEMRDGGALFEDALKAATKGEDITPSAERYLPGMVGNTKKEEMPVLPVVNKGRERVKGIQERLIAHGYGEIVGAADGLYGPKTAKAIETFESTRQIKLDHVDAATWEVLQKQAAGEKA